MIDILYYILVLVAFVCFFIVVGQKPEFTPKNNGEFEEKASIMFFALPVVAALLFFMLGLGGFDIEKHTCFSDVTSKETIDNTTTYTNSINCETQTLLDETAAVWFDVFATICALIFIWRIFALMRKSMGAN